MRAKSFMVIMGISTRVLNRLGTREDPTEPNLQLVNRLYPKLAKTAYGLDHFDCNGCALMRGCKPERDMPEPVKFPLIVMFLS